MQYKIVRHTPFQAVYIYIDAAKALRKAQSIVHSGSSFVILDGRTDKPLTIDELAAAVKR